jgi:hypothetical protein
VLRRLFSLALLSLVLLVPPLARGGSPSLVVSQVYGGGGNAGASFQNDFVELFNRGSDPVDLTGWTVQYATASSTSWQKTTLAGAVQPGRYYLVQEAAGTQSAPALPSPDATGTSNLSSASGKIALVHDTAALTCGASAGSCSAGSAVVDFVGYGAAADYEGPGPAPALGNTAAALRADGGCTDSDSNAADFVAGAPSPRSSATASQSCTSDSAPSVVSTSPADGATGVATDAVVTIGFDEPVTLANGAVSISCETSGAHAVTVSGGPTTFTVTPTASFGAGEACTVTVSASGVADVDAIDPPDSLAADRSFSFTTAAPPSGGRDDEGATVTADVATVLTLSLERPVVDFGRLAWKATPPPASEKLTVVTNDPAGYTLTVHRSAFAPDDLPLGLTSSSAGGPGHQLGNALGGGAVAAIPVTPALDLLIGTSSAPTDEAGDVWPASLAFTGPLPFSHAGPHTATVTFTVIGR